jgi:hypothetical protein
MEDLYSLTDVQRIKLAKMWFNRHSSALDRWYVIRDNELSNAQRVKIAIFDSGIYLSEQNMDLYSETQPRIVYRSWIDQDQAWKDEAGHGTHLTVLLRKIAPQAVVHAARVYAKKPRWSSGEVVAQVRYPGSDTATYVDCDRLYEKLSTSGKLT